MRAFSQQSEVSRQKPSAGSVVREGPTDHAHPVLDMQRTMGNRAVQRFLAAGKPGPVVQRAPAGLQVRNTDPESDPQATLAPPAMKRWEKLFAEILALQGNLGKAETASPSVTRKGWVHELGELW